MTVEGGLSRELLRRAFASLNRELASSSQTTDVFVFGGAVMVLSYDARPVTRDVDAVWRPHGPTQQAASRVAAELGLPNSWLNEQASFYLPSNVEWAGQTLFEGSHLKVIAAPPELMLAMKARAGRPVDLEDVVVLSRALGLRSASEVMTIVERVFDEPLNAQKRIRLEERFESF